MRRRPAAQTDGQLKGPKTTCFYRSFTGYLQARKVDPVVARGARNDYLSERRICEAESGHHRLGGKEYGRKGDADPPSAALAAGLARRCRQGWGGDAAAVQGNASVG